MDDPQVSRNIFGNRVFGSLQQSHQAKVQDIAVMQQLQLHVGIIVSLMN